MLAVIGVYLVVIAGTFAALVGLYLVGLPWMVETIADAYRVSPDLGILLAIGVLFGVAVAAYEVGQELLETPIERVAAEPIYERAYREELQRLDRLATRADVPTPDVYRVESAVPTAFTAGLTPSSARIVITTGLLDRGPSVIDAAFAHELAHVKHHDAAVMYAAQVFPGIAYAIANAVYRPIWGDGGPDPDAALASPAEAARSRAGEDAEIGREEFASGGGSGAAAAGVDGDALDPRALIGVVLLTCVAIVTALVTGVIALVAWLASTAIYRLLSQTREFAADRTAAELTSDPAAVAEMLTTLGDGAVRAPDEDLRDLDGGHEPLYVLGIARSMFETDPGRLLSADVFPASHPPTEERVDRLLATTDEPGPDPTRTR